MPAEWTRTLPLVLLDSSLRVVVVAALVALILTAARVRSSGVRHGAWASVLLAMLLMPVLPRVVPSFTVAVPAPLPRIETMVAAPQRSYRPDTAAVSIPMREVPAQSVRPVQRDPSAAAPRRASLWPVLLLATYAAGVLALLLRLFAGWRAMWRLARGASPALRVLGVQVYESTAIAAPVTAGVLSPRIILPRMEGLARRHTARDPCARARPRRAAGSAGRLRLARQPMHLLVPSATHRMSVDASRRQRMSSFSRRPEPTCSGARGGIRNDRCSGDSSSTAQSHLTLRPTRRVACSRYRRTISRTPNAATSCASNRRSSPEAIFPASSAPATD